MELRSADVFINFDASGKHRNQGFGKHVICSLIYNDNV